MAKACSPWRALRPLLLAGAVTAAWLTFSASAATADSSTGSESVLGNADSMVLSLSAPLAGSLTPPQGASSPASSPSALLQPVVEGQATTAEQLMPGVNNVVPAGTVTAVAVPVAAVSDATVDCLVATITPPLTDALPVLEPVLQPVVDLVAASGPSLPMTLTDRRFDEITIFGDVSATSDATAAATTATAERVSHDASRSPRNTSVHLPAATGTSSSAVMSNAEFRSALPGSPWTNDPSAPLTPGPAGPASGTGSGASQSGPSGSAAWLDELGFNLPLRGSFPISGSLQHAPSPVSLNPGSSPD